MSESCPNCPDCQSSNVTWKAKAGQWECNDCETRFEQPSSTDIPDTKAFIDDKLTAYPDLPTYLAIPLAAYFDESHPRVKLLWMCDAVELTARFAVAVLLAEIRANQQEDTLPNDVKRILAGKIERPTFGAWVNLLKDLLNAHQPEEPKVAGGLLAWMVNPLEQGGSLSDLIKPDAKKDLNFVELRNLLAHGGGISLKAAASELEQFHPRFIELMDSLNLAMVDLSVISLDGDKAWSLKSKTPQHINRPTIAVLEEEASKTWLAGATDAIELAPLLRYESVRHPLTDDRGETAPQCYYRGNFERQDYTPLGSDDMCSSFKDGSFEKLFKHHEQKNQSTTGARPSCDFIDEARQLSNGMSGRIAELKALKDWRKARQPFVASKPRMGLFTGQPGMGKSMLMAKLAADLGNGENLYYHRFKGGDSRNNRSDFLHGLGATLENWLIQNGAPSDTDREKDPEKRVLALLSGINAIPLPRDERKARPFFTLILDGLDEITAHDAKFPDLIKKLAEPLGCVWLLSSRLGLEAHFGDEHCRIPNLSELKGMSAPDIREMLMQGLDGAKAKGLIKQDNDENANAPPANAYIEAILEKAEGLPLYVHYVIEDILTNQKTFDIKQLPAGLTAYYTEMLERLGISDEKKYLHDVIAVLASSDEPLDRTALALLLGDEAADPTYEQAFIERVLNLGRSMLKETQTAEGTFGYTLYHTSFRDHVIIALQRTVNTARKTLYEKAMKWQELEPGILRNHLLRRGNRYALKWQPNGADVVRQRLTDFYWLMARLEQPVNARLEELITEYQELYEKMATNEPGFVALNIWREFMRGNRHVLNQALDYLPANRLLLQMAIGHADESPITQQAEAWLKQGHCDFIWLNAQHRQHQLEPDPCLLVLQEKPPKPVMGVLNLPDNTLLSWSEDADLRLWDIKSGALVTKLKGHTAKINGAQRLNDGRILSWSDDGTLRVWKLPQYSPVATLNSFQAPVIGVHIFKDDRIVAWSKNGSIGEWDGQSDSSSIVLTNIKNDIQWNVLNARELTNGRLLLCVNVANFYDETEYEDFDEISGEYRHSYQVTKQRVDTELYEWKGNQLKKLRTLAYYQGEYSERSILGANILTDSRILTWGFNWGYRKDPYVLELMNSDGGQLWPEKRFKKPIKGTHALSDGRILYWMQESKSFYLIDDGYGTPIELTGYDSDITGVEIGSNDRILSWSEDATLCLRNVLEDTPISLMKGHYGRVNGANFLADGNIISWSIDGAIRLWDAQRKTALDKIKYGSVQGVIVLSNNRILSWFDDFHLAVFNSDNGDCLGRWFAHKATILGVAKQSNGQIISWSKDGLLKIWDPQNFTCIATRDESPSSLSDIQVLGNGCILYKKTVDHEDWPSSESIINWDVTKGTIIDLELRSVIEIMPVPIVLEDSRVLVWGDGYCLKPGSKKHNNLLQPSHYNLVIIDGATGKEIKTLKGHTKTILGAFPLENSQILSWSIDKTLRLWDINIEECLCVWLNENDSIKGAKLLADNKIITWSKDHSLLVRDPSDQNLLIKLSGHTGPIKGAQIFDDHSVLSWSDDFTLRLWNTQNGSCQAELKGHTDSIEQVLILDETRIITLGRDHTLRLWSIALQSCLKQWHLNFLHVYGDSNDQQNTLRSLYSLFTDYDSGTHLAMVSEGGSSEIINISRNGLMTLVTERKQLRFMQINHGNKKIPSLIRQLSPIVL